MNPNAKGVLPLDVTRISSPLPCESCSVKRSQFKVTLNPPGPSRVTHRLCDRCIEGLRNK